MVETRTAGWAAAAATPKSIALDRRASVMHHSRRAGLERLQVMPLVCGVFQNCNPPIGTRVLSCQLAIVAGRGSSSSRRQPQHYVRVQVGPQNSKTQTLPSRPFTPNAKRQRLKVGPLLGSLESCFGTRRAAELKNKTVSPGLQTDPLLTHGLRRWHA